MGFGQDIQDDELQVDEPAPVDLSYDEQQAKRAIEGVGGEVSEKGYTKDEG